MPQITEIEEQKANSKRQAKNKEKRFNVFLNGKYSFSIGEEHLIKTKLKEGQELTLEQLEGIKSREFERKLTDLAVNFLSYRQRSEKELQDYIIKSISKLEKIKWHQAKESELIEKILAKLKKYSLVNDEQFTKWWINARTKSSPKSTQVIKTELRKKGIDAELINQLLPKNTERDLEMAFKILQKKQQRLKNLNEQQIKNKIYQWLATRGFDFDTIKKAFALYLKKR